MVSVLELEEEVNKVVQKSKGCLVDTEAVLLKLPAVDPLSPADCQKSKGDFEDNGIKSNPVELAEGDWSVGSAVDVVVVDDEAREVVVVVVGIVVGLARKEVVEDLQRKKSF